MRWVITGANRGIGLELVRQVAARGHEVDATARDPEKATELAKLAAGSGGKIRVHACDVASDESVAALSRSLGDGPIDVLLNNAGITGKRAGLGELDFADMLATYNVNALGPLRVSAALVDRVKASATKRIIHITSGMGSIADNSMGGAYGYRMSKAALNMANKNLSIDLRKDGVTCVVINPGWVKTDMGGASAMIDATESVKGMLEVLDGISLDGTGAFLSYNKKTFPY
jgi:NAD(P)-dependent dehydrogenase (short-subunit alcohol dehydrogenase family)